MCEHKYMEEPVHVCGHVCGHGLSSYITLHFNFIERFVLYVYECFACGYVCTLCVCTHVHACLCLHPLGSKKGIESPGTEVIDGCEPPCDCSGINFGLWQDLSLYLELTHSARLGNPQTPGILPVCLPSQGFHA